HVVFDEGTFPSISLKNTTLHIFNLRSIFLYISREARESTTIPLTETISDQEEQPTVAEEELEPCSEHQPSRIQVIGPRHPTLISSKIDPENILSFCRRSRTNLTQTRVDEVPKSYNEALSVLDKEKWAEAIQNELKNMEKIKV
ncbi:hypothetical protein O181_024079, partial [Austropuccinia psidii MF-1]|nr:hypothetical protein [Austropuccinia psidii MF-1]